MIKSLGLFLAATGVALLLAEAVVRVAYPQQLGVWYSQPDGVVIHPPGFSTYLADFKQKITYNSIGMRDKEHDWARTTKALRIVVLGDSFMEAHQVAFEDSFPSLLESKLRDALHRDVEVINCSVSGWSQDSELAYLERYGGHLRPDFILVAMTLHNDVQENLREQFHALEHDDLIRRPAVRIPPHELRILRLKGYLASHSHLWQLVRKFKLLRELEGQANALDRHVMELLSKHEEESSEISRGWKLTFRLFEGISEQGRKSGADTLVMLIPLKIQLQKDSLDKFARVQGKGSQDFDLEKPQRHMAAFARGTDIRLVDLLPAFREWTFSHRTSENGRSLHFEEGHWNEEGHRLAAELAATAIVERIAVSARPTSMAGM